MTRSHIGKTIYVAAALPATNTAAGFDALTWVKVNGLQSVGSLGVSHAAIDVPDLETGFNGRLKGAASGNDVDAAFRAIDGDAGQASVETLATGPSGECSIKIVRGSGASNAPVLGDPVEYAQGYLHSYVDIEKSDSTHEGFTVKFQQNAHTVKATHP